MKIGFIGCGNMATAIAKGVAQKQLFPPDAMIGTDIIAETRAHFFDTTHIPTTDDTLEVLQADFVIIAIKPQQYDAFFTQYANHIPNTTTIISIAAGKTLAALSSHFQNQPIVRIMPNLNATIGQSVTALTHNDHVTADQLKTVTDIVTSFGTLHLLDERQFSAFTAIAGSSPAYFFKMIEAMSISAAKNGIDYTIAKQIIIDTMIGSAVFASTTATELPQLIQNVTSPNGTTEAALRVFEAQHFDTLIDDAQRACIARDIELGK